MTLVGVLEAEALRYLYVLSMACSFEALRKGALATLVVAFVLAALHWRNVILRRPGTTSLRWPGHATKGREQHDRAA